MAKKATRKYAPSAGEDVKSEMHRYKRGTAKSGPGGKGGKVKSRKQAIAIGLSKARKDVKRSPRRPLPEPGKRRSPMNFRAVRALGNRCANAGFVAARRI